MHQPVFLSEVINFLEVKREGKYIDATFGEGGHSWAILKKGGKVLAIEWDEWQFKIQKEKTKKWPNFKLVWGNFKDIEKIAKKNLFYPVDGILFDLGLSMSQIEDSKRGFSYKKLTEPLDMRISQKIKIKAADIVNSYSVEKLYEIFAKNSEEIYSWTIANAIFCAAKIKPIKKVADLVKIINSLNLKEKEKIYRRIFQALRIEVNQEEKNLKEGLRGALKIVKPKGKIVVITFHPTEDRWVKQFIKENKLRLIKVKNVIKKERKIFERSAHLRVFSLN